MSSTRAKVQHEEQPEVQHGRGMSTPALTVENLSVSFPAGQTRVAVVDGVSFRLAAGEIVGLAGESGCGKTITAAALLGLSPEPSGRVTIGRLRLSERDLAGADEKTWRQIRGNRISMIFQDPMTALDPVFTIGAQLTEVIHRHRQCTKRLASEKALEALRSLEFADCPRILRSYPHELSGGMRQRVMIAMAMACKPAVLIADEPSASLDAATQAHMLKQLRDLARRTGTAILLITHDLNVVARLCDRAMIMYCGRLAEQGPVDALFANPRHPYTAALLAALPSIRSGGVQPVRPIPGSVPPLQALPSGCRFHNRCMRADAKCRDVVPPWIRSDPAASGKAGAGQSWACHHPLPTDGRAIRGSESP